MTISSARIRAWLTAAILISGFASQAAGPVPTPWVPIFKGVDLANGTNTPGQPGNFAELEVVRCVRVDLTDPDVQLLTTPRAPSYLVDSRETLDLSVPDFIRSNKVQVAADSNFYNVSPGGSDPTSENLSSEVYGLQISAGVVVSGSTSEGDPRYCSLLFTTNKQPFYLFNNRPPGTNTTGIYTAVTGYYPLVSNGVDISYATSNAYYSIDPSIHGIQPRTAYGTSADNRYLYLMTIDGRQSGYSDGAYDTETSYWIRQFGAYNAIMMDGGGSTAMYMANSVGSPVAINHSSYLPSYGRERYIGSHLGVYAKPVPGFFTNIVVLADDTAATVTWTTIDPSTTAFRYGLTTNFNLTTGTNLTLTNSHALLLTNLTPGTNYYYQLIGAIGTSVYVSSNLLFSTTNYVNTLPLFGLAQPWTYTTANLDGVNWKASGYNDSGWPGSGPGALWADAYGTPESLPISMTTQMPVDPGSGYPYNTYYFRTHFQFTNQVNGVGLYFQDYVDCGAVFYLNGTEITRVRMPSGAIANATLASGPNPCAGQVPQVCPDNWAIIGSQVATNLLVGDNVLAVEVHNDNALHHAVTFDLSLTATVPYTLNPVLTLGYTNQTATLGWTRGGFTVQQAGSPTGTWVTASGLAFSSPYTTTNAGTNRFFRLKK